MSSLPQEKLDRLCKALDPLHRQYDPIVGMLRVPLQSSGFLKFFKAFQYIQLGSPSAMPQRY